MSRLTDEKRVVELMIRLYCRHKEGNETLCASCDELLRYAMTRLDHCRFADSKPTCRKCPIHCYKPEMKTRIREVMRWAGPRMMLYHPVVAIKHTFREIIK